MLLAAVDYYRPETVAEAMAALAESEGARVLAGGQSLVSLLKFRATRVDLLIDISRLEELRFIETMKDGSVRIGAGVTYDELGESAQLRAAHPKVCEIARATVDQQIRNRGTIGGNVCHNDPINNFPVLTVALGATMGVKSSRGERDIAAGGFFTGFFATSLEHDEILHSITLPALEGGASVGWSEVEIGEAAARAVAVIKTNRGTITDARVVLGCLPAPAILSAVEEALRGGPATAEAIAAATAGAAEGIDFFPHDADASSGYRRAMAPVVAKRAVLDAIGGNKA
jgi:carbon-monoxide dehydrogenase medium subunit